MSDNLKDTVVEEGPPDDGDELVAEDPVLLEPVVELCPAGFALGLVDPHPPSTTTERHSAA